MNDLAITLNRQPFEHDIYHFVLPYSNWETGTLCFSESFEALSEGLQNALWQLGGVPQAHQSDRLSAAVNNLSDLKEFTERYAALLRHYSLSGQKINATKANENGDVEQRHHRFKRSVDQQLMLRGSRDFASQQEYAAFLQQLLAQLNAGRHERFAEELKLLRRLPAKRFDSTKTLQVSVSKGSTICVGRNIYSVHSRLIGEQVQVKVQANHLEVWYGQKCVETFPRLRGKGKHRIQYRHIIDWLVRKPGAFENYCYESDLYPTHRFRMVYDTFKEQNPQRANKDYVNVLHLAAEESQEKVDQALEHLLASNQSITYETVEQMVKSEENKCRTEVTISPVDLGDYDELLAERVVPQ